MSANAWLKQIQKAVGKQPDAPKGWKTRAQLAREWDRSGARAREILRALVASGKAEMREFRAQRGSYTVPTPHYRLK